MLLSEKGNSTLQEQVIGFSPVAVVIALTALSLWLSSKLVNLLPLSAIGILQRTFGLLLGALSVEFVIQGIRQAFSI
jgi:small neutral amino acid transporter SnatA (MarC family)